MSDTLRYLLVGIILMLTHFQEAITGFGCTALALPFVVLLLGLKTAVPVLVALAWILALYIIIVSRKQIVWREYRIIVVLAAIGLPVGMWASTALPEEGLKWVLAIFMAGIGIHGLVRQMAGAPATSEMSTRKKWLLRTFIPLGGVIQGAFGSGGPLVVIYGTRALPEKSLFRVTMCLVWLTINSIVLTQRAINHQINLDVLRIIALCLPFTLIGMVLGNIAHHRINESVFRKMVYAVLIASGLALVWSLL